MLTPKHGRYGVGAGPSWKDGGELDSGKAMTLTLKASGPTIGLISGASVGLLLGILASLLFARRAV